MVNVLIIPLFWPPVWPVFLKHSERVICIVVWNFHHYWQKEIIFSITVVCKLNLMFFRDFKGRRFSIFKIIVDKSSVNPELLCLSFQTSCSLQKSSGSWQGVSLRWNFAGCERSPCFVQDWRGLQRSATYSLRAPVVHAGRQRMVGVRNRHRHSHSQSEPWYPMA